MIEGPLVVAGALTGFLVGLTGVGGGALMTPVLLLFFGVAPLAAIGTDLWFAAITKLFATRVHHGQNLVDWSVVKRLWAGSLPASFLTLIWLEWHPVNDALATVLKEAVAVAIIFTAVSLLFQKKIQLLGRKYRTTEAARFKSLQTPLTVAAGAVLGLLVTMTSIGAGALGAVCLAYLYPLRLTPPRLIATDIVHAIPLAIFAGLGHLMIGNVDAHLLANLLLGSVPAVIVGAVLSSRLPHAALRAVLAAVLAAIGLKLLISFNH